MVQVFRKINFVTTLSDGVIIDLKPKIYNISGTTEVSPLSNPLPIDTYDELSSDYKSVSNNIIKFDGFLTTNQIIYDGYNEPGGFKAFGTEIQELPDKRFFMIMAQIFNDKDKFNTFKSLIITNEMDKSTSTLKRKFNTIVNNFEDKVKNELSAEEVFYKKLKKSKEYRDYLVVENLYKKGKTRKFIYNTEPSSRNDEQSSNLMLLYKGNNIGDKTTWTDKTQFN
jgi:hypothetical protein